ncbi:tail fiber protein [Paenibacillus fonticola]|uniref:tail fiber protein n=1 Tax=Paenibacillus fonticola TaxID=379896 RepID=UPI00037803CD|nr:phage tail protein [Paenibacillus fonticola]
MSIQQPRKLVPTDQGHAEVINAPIETLYGNDLFLAKQVVDILANPADHGVVSEQEFQNHINNAVTHITAAERTKWDAAEANAKKYTDDNAAKKSHTHAASDLPSATTQARGIVQLSTSTVSTAADQAATPSAVKAAMDRANEAFQAGNERKKNVVDALIALGVSASIADSWDTLISKMGTVNKGLDRYFLFRRGVINLCNFIEVSRGGDGYVSFVQSGSEVYMTASCINVGENRSYLTIGSTLQQDLSHIKYVLIDPLLRRVTRESNGYPYVRVGVCTPDLLNTEIFNKEVSYYVNPGDGRYISSAILDVSDLVGVFHLKMIISAEYNSRIELGISNILLIPHD